MFFPLPGLEEIFLSDNVAVDESMTNDNNSMDEVNIDNAINDEIAVESGAIDDMTNSDVDALDHADVNDDSLIEVVETVLRTTRLRSPGRKKIKKINKMPVFEVKMTKRQAEKEMGHERRVDCVSKELTQMFVDKKVLEPKMKSEVPRKNRKKPIRLSCRYDIKYDGAIVLAVDRSGFRFPTTASTPAWVTNIIVLSCKTLDTLMTSPCSST